MVALLLLSVAVAVLFVYPTVMVVVGAFRTSSPGFPGEWSGQAFVDAYTSGETYELLWNSAAYALATTTLSLTLAVFFAWMVTQTNTPGRRLVTPLMVALITLPFLFFGISWAMLGNERVGLLNQLLRTFIPVEEGPINIRSWGGIISVSTLKITAINYMLMLGIFRTLDPALREASLIAGVSRRRTFFRIELPVLAPVLLALGLMGFVRGLESFDVPLLLGGPAGIQVFSTQIYDYLTTSFPPSYAQASALAVLVMVIMLVLVLLMWRFIGKREFTTVGGKGQRIELVDLGRWKYACTAAVVVYALVALAFPLVQLVLGSLQPEFGVLSASLTLEHYRAIFDSPLVVQALQNTAFIVVVGGFLAVLLAVVVAYIVQRSQSKFRWFLEGATWLPWGLPGIVLALGMLWAYLSVPFLRGLFATTWIVMLGLIVVSTPIAVRLANAAIAQVHRQLEEAARIHGASQTRAAVGIVLRLILPSLLAGWLIVGVIMAGDLAIPVMLSGPQSQTVPVVLLQLLDSGQSSQAAAVFCVMLGAMALVLALGSVLRIVGTRLVTRGAPTPAAATPAETAQAAIPVPVAAEPDLPPVLVPTRPASGGE
ncbi:ABC transporter permease [Geodermatophilus sp. CPCC 206100]|uniref:ABC transporter permease n=1 Tax=Geodermatophilus sp. CPCC 206100 TaxID=3020054 RepID=UPI003B00ADC7